MFTNIGNNRLCYIFYIAVSAELRSRHCLMPAAAKLFHDDLHINGSVGARGKAESVLRIVEKEAAPYLLHGNKEIRHLSCDNLGIRRALRTYGKGHVFIHLFHIGQIMDLILMDARSIEKSFLTKAVSAPHRLR